MSKHTPGPWIARETSVQCHDVQCKGGEIRLDPSEWPALREAINRMVKECKE